MSRSTLSDGYLKGLEVLTKECFRSGDIKKCRVALIHIEEYQLFASNSQEYSCQTRLLGLASEIVIATLPGRTKQPSEKMMQQVKKSCSGVLD